MIDLSRLREDAFHLVATLHTTEPLTPAMEAIINDVQRDEAFMLHIFIFEANLERLVVRGVHAWLNYNDSFVYNCL